MSHGWPRVPLGEVLRQVVGASHPVHADRDYPNFGIYSFGRGLFPKPPISPHGEASLSSNPVTNGFSSATTSRGSRMVAVHRCSSRCRAEFCARAGTFANGRPLVFQATSPWLLSTSRSLIRCSRRGCRHRRTAFRTSRSLRTLHPSTPPASSLTQTPGNSIGGSVPANHAPTAASKYSNTDRPCCVHVAITVQIRSHQRFPFSLRVPCVIRRSITTNRIACSARLFVGSTPGVVMNRK